MTISEKSGSRTKKTEVMQSLYHRYALFVAGRINGWGNHSERVVHVDKVRFLSFQQLSEFGSNFTVPNRPAHKTHATEARVILDFEVSAFVTNNRMAMLLEQPALLPEDDILPARLLIRIVNHYDLQRRTPVAKLCGDMSVGFRS
jgi:hypothetical protein